MARAGRVFGNEAWVASARRSLAFIRTTMWKDSRLFATYKDGRIYEGAFKSARPQGTGVMTYPDGYRYEGDWVENFK